MRVAVRWLLQSPLVPIWSICPNWPNGSAISRPRSRRCGGFFDVEAKQLTIEELERQLTQPEVWGDPDRVKTIQQKRSRLATDVEVAREVDTLFALNFLCLNGPTPPVIEACNTNDDQEVDIGDALYLVWYLFVSGPEPPAPFPDPGRE